MDLAQSTTSPSIVGKFWARQFTLISWSSLWRGRRAVATRAVCYSCCWLDCLGSLSLSVTNYRLSSLKRNEAWLPPPGPCRQSVCLSVICHCQCRTVNQLIGAPLPPPPPALGKSQMARVHFRLHAPRGVFLCSSRWSAAHSSSSGSQVSCTHRLTMYHPTGCLNAGISTTFQAILVKLWGVIYSRV